MYQRVGSVREWIIGYHGVIAKHFYRKSINHSAISTKNSEVDVMKIKQFFLGEIQKRLSQKYTCLKIEQNIYTPHGCIIYKYSSTNELSLPFNQYLMIETFRRFNEEATMSVMWKNSSNIDTDLPPIFAKLSEPEGRLRIATLEGKNLDHWWTLPLSEIRSARDRLIVLNIISDIEHNLEKYIFPFFQDMEQYKMKNIKSAFLCSFDN